MAISKFAIRRRIEIDAAHRIPDHRSKCFNLHGHRYVIEAEVEGELYPEGEQRGMVMDFGFLKALMMKHIHEPCDHGMILYVDDPLLPTFEDRANYNIPYPFMIGVKMYVIDAVPTAENLAHHWFEAMEFPIHNKLLGEGQQGGLVQVCVWETPNCCAMYPPIPGDRRNALV